MSLKPDDASTGSLERSQHALAALFTDAAQRERLADEPQAFAVEHDLSAGQLADLQSIEARRFSVYASTLDRKRVSEAAAFFPLAAAANASAFRLAFLGHARSTPLPATRHRYRDDALAFADAIRARARGREAAPSLADELTLFEADALAVAARRLPLFWRRFAYRVGDAAHDPPAAPLANPTLVVWSGWPRRVVRQFALPRRPAVQPPAFEPAPGASNFGAHE